MTDRSIFSGITVIDLSTMIAGPLTCGIVGDFGADVIKIEAVGNGDPIRLVGRSYNGQNVRSKVTNRNKRSVAIDLHFEEGRALVRDLVAKADAVVTNFRASTLEQWNLDYASIVDQCPEIVWLHLTGFGLSGTRCDLTSFAPIAEAFGGLAYISGQPDGPPEVSSASMGDLIAGAYGAFCLTAALLHRLQTGHGQLIDLGLYEPVLRLLEPLIADFDLTGHVEQRWGNQVPGTVPSNLYRTADGEWIAIAASTQPVFERLCRAIGRPNLAGDPAYASNAQRVEKRAELNSAIQERLASMTWDEVDRAMLAFGVAYSKVQSAKDIVADEHMSSRRNLIDVYDPNLGRTIKMQAPVPRFDRTPGAVKRPGPEVGQDTEDVLTSLLSISQDDLASLRAAGIVG